MKERRSTLLKRFTGNDRVPQSYVMPGSFVLIAVIALVVCFQAQHDWHSTDAAGIKTFAVRDFGAFYCAGAARDVGGDPYLTTDFINCGGRRAGHAPLRDEFDSPAPLPGYDVALFALIAKLPYRLAAYVWLLVSAIAVFGGAIILSRTATLPPLLIAVSFSIVAMMAFLWGQLAPISLGALCLLAYAVETDAIWLAAFAASLCAIEPHLGLPAMLATALLRPRTRVPLAFGSVVLAFASFVAVGIDGNIEYFTKVTPLHVMAEVSMNNQYSLTWLLHAFGVSAGLAIRLGSVSYVLLIAIGLALARPVARAISSSAAVPLVPVACATLGGPFIHNTQIALALPAMLLVAGKTRGREPLLWIACGLLAVVWWVPQWQYHAYGPTRFESLAVSMTIAFYAAWRVVPRRALVAAAGAGLAYIAITAALLHMPATSWEQPESVTAYATQLGSDVRFASGHYGVMIRENAAKLTQISWQLVATKIPYWLAPIIFIFVAVRRTRSGLITAHAPEHGLV